MIFERETGRPGKQVAIRQDRAQTVARVRLAPGLLRYAYDLARDSRESHEPGQDYLVFRYGDGRLAFAVCDGVGGSFLGHLAAQFLGDHLVAWLWDSAAPRSDAELQDGLSRFLEGLVAEARQWIGSYPLPKTLSPLLRTVLEGKRSYGSETMFVCGRLEWPSAQSTGLVAIAALGDAELQLWNSSGALTLQGKTQERWSTHRGPRGQLRTVIESAGKIRRLLAYSDGLRSIAGELLQLPDNLLDQEIARLQQSPQSDDISLIDIALDETDMAASRGVPRAAVPPTRAAPREGTSKAMAPEERSAPHVAAVPTAPTPMAPAPSFLSPAADTPLARGSKLTWTSVAGAEAYEIEQATSESFAPSEVLESRVVDPWLIVDDDAGLYWYRVRAETPHGKGAWSRPLRVVIDTRERGSRELP
jgi:hypothetical protein